MTLETLPVVLGVIIGLLGLVLLWDAWMPEQTDSAVERRARPRRERDRRGEALLGVGVLAMAAAFIARDQWRYSILTVLIGMVAMLWGVKRNGAYLRGLFSRRRTAEPTVVEGPRRIR